MALDPNDAIISVPEPEAHALTSSQMRSSIRQSTEPVKNTVQSSKNRLQIPPTNSISPTQKQKQVEYFESDPKEEGNHDICKDEKKLENKRKRMNLKRFIVFMELTAFLIIMGLLIASLEADKLQNSKIWDLEIWKWCLLLLVILCGRLISCLLTEIIRSFIWKFFLNEKILYFAHGVKKNVIFCLWLGLVTLSWRLMINHNAAQRKTSRALAGFLIGSGLWLFKTVFVKLIFCIHGTKLLEKIKEAIRLRKVLRDVSEMKAKPNTDKTLSKVEKVSKETIEELIDAISGKRLQPLSYDCIICHKEHEINDDAKAKRAAEVIFNELATPDGYGRYMDLKNLTKFFEDDKDYQYFLGVAEKSNPAGYQRNNTDEDDKLIKRSVFRSWVVDIYKDHDSLNSTLKHSKTAIDELNMIASMIVIFIIMVVWLLFMGFLSIKILVFLASQLLLAAFIFGNTVKTIFEAVILIFVVHPFDIGDTCVIDGVQMVVDEMNILTTTFVISDNEKIYYPNAVLASKPISNVRVSKSITECLEFAINLQTRMEYIYKMEEEIRRYVEDNPSRWQPEHSVQYKEIENMNKLKMSVSLNHTANFHDVAKRAKRRSDFVLKLKRIFEELGVEYNLPPQRVHVVTSVTSPSNSLTVPPWHLSRYLSFKSE